MRRNDLTDLLFVVGVVGWGAIIGFQHHGLFGAVIGIVVGLVIVAALDKLFPD